MTDNTPPPPAALSGSSLAILKGFVWGMGVLLIVGVIGLAAMIASKKDEAPEAATTPPVAIMLDEIPMAPGEVVAETHFDERRALLVIAVDGRATRLVMVDFRDGSISEKPFSN